ncbi:class I SAM-dependent methyltransferase [Ornithinimicrobium flavum]|uniref:class I SAM-dependent methyltransferase n=1 Tax=Ornithinimicrobium flavum TaxID=1288636 RepID=UPI001EE81A96|nr:class I SAM-dependent methyltransferase [Ornithinimicrobium flavum]
MVDLARRRLGEEADLHEADLGEPLPFGDAEFDLVVASLVLHYLQDWSGPLTELRRVLRPGGRLLVSVNHPGAYTIVYPQADYFSVTQYTEDYTFDGRAAVLTFWHRPLHDMAAAFASAASASPRSPSRRRRRTPLRSCCRPCAGGPSSASSSSRSRPSERGAHETAHTHHCVWCLRRRRSYGRPGRDHRGPSDLTETSMRTTIATAAATLLLLEARVPPPPPRRTRSTSTSTATTASPTRSGRAATAPSPPVTSWVSPACCCLSPSSAVAPSP